MRLTRILLLMTLVALPAPAMAQSFFEELFGIGRGAKPPQPPRNVPSQPVAPAPGTEPAPDPQAEAPRPAPLKPVVLKAPADDNVLGQDLMLNGLTGSLKLERAGSGVAARMSVPGMKVSQPAESCKVPLSGGGPIPLTPEGRPDGVARFQLASPECPLRIEVLEGAVVVSAQPGAACAVQASDCAAGPAGFWGPAAAGLIPRSGEFDTGRGVADKAVRENYKVMTQRARGGDVRPIVTEQAAFSADREQLCRGYAREGAHGFCHVRVTEARAVALAVRLGATPAPAAAAATPRPRRKPSVEGMNPEGLNPGPAGVE